VYSAFVQGLVPRALLFDAQYASLSTVRPRSWAVIANRKAEQGALTHSQRGRSGSGSGSGSPPPAESAADDQVRIGFFLLWVEFPFVWALLVDTVLTVLLTPISLTHPVHINLY
jgi:hypothetical protein